MIRILGRGRSAALLAALIGGATLSGCSLDGFGSPRVVPIGSSEGNTIDVVIDDKAELIVDARAADPMSPDDELSVQPVPGNRTALIVSWIGSSCETSATLTVDVTHRQQIALSLDRGPLSQGECPAIGAVYSIELEFSRRVAPNDVVVQP